jgi:hypothetical protein
VGNHLGIFVVHRGRATGILLALNPSLVLFCQCHFVMLLFRFFLLATVATTRFCTVLRRDECEWRPRLRTGTSVI